MCPNVTPGRPPQWSAKPASVGKSRNLTMIRACAEWRMGTSCPLSVHGRHDRVPMESRTADQVVGEVELLEAAQVRAQLVDDAGRLRHRLGLVTASKPAVRCKVARSGRSDERPVPLTVISMHRLCTTDPPHPPHGSGRCSIMSSWP